MSDRHLASSLWAADSNCWPQCQQSCPSNAAPAKLPTNRKVSTVLCRYAAQCCVGMQRCLAEAPLHTPDPVQGILHTPWFLAKKTQACWYAQTVASEGFQSALGVGQSGCQVVCNSIWNATLAAPSHLDLVCQWAEVAWSPIIVLSVPSCPMLRYTKACSSWMFGECGLSHPHTRNGKYRFDHSNVFAEKTPASADAMHVYGRCNSEKRICVFPQSMWAIPIQPKALLSFRSITIFRVRCEDDYQEVVSVC